MTSANALSGTVANRVELKAYIRFQLSQLSARNAHHEFELLCFELARQRVQPNILPATGPVQAGGDQGRDFETFHSSLQGREDRARFGHGRNGHTSAVFACTLDKKTKTKIRADLKIIFSTGVRPERVIYFLEQGVPVGLRHKLRGIALEEYGSELEIFDGEAIADMLADPDVFWIAEQFLRIPSDLFPRVQIDADYLELRRNWLETAELAASFADFVEIKRGLRRATFKDAMKPDLGSWIDRMRAFVECEDRHLARKALYEICVAQLRGRNNLDPEAATLSSFLETFPSDPSVSEIQDYVVLASYAYSASQIGHFGWPKEDVQHRLLAALPIVERGIKVHRSDADEFVLQRCKVHLYQHSLDEGADSRPAQRIVEALERCVALATRCPICDIESLSKMVELLVPYVGATVGFSEMAHRLDALVAVRGGNAAAAENCRNRAIKYREIDDLLRAIDQFQRAKEGWFAGETMRGSILSTLMLARSYADLNLSFASRFYAMGALAMALQTGDEDNHDLAPDAALLVAESFFVTGHGLRFTAALGSALVTQENFRTNPFDLEQHPEIARQLAHAGNVRLYTEKVAPNLLTYLLAQTETWPLTEADKEQLYEMVKEGPLIDIAPDALVAKTVAEIGQAFFQEFGDTGSIEWRALGISWRIDFKRSDELRAEQVVALLQVLQVDLALEDLHLIPSDVSILVEETDCLETALQFQPDNKRSAWVMEFPSSESAPEDEEAIAFSICLEVIGRCTVLPAQEFNSIVQRAIERGLMNRAFWVRSASKMMAEAREIAQLNDIPIDVAAPPMPEAAPLEARQLAWNDRPGRGYSLEKAEELIGNRYRRLGGFARNYVPKIMEDVRISAQMKELRQQGYKDWHLLLVLFNVVMNLSTPNFTNPRLYREAVTGGRIRKIFDEFESGHAALPDVSLMTEELIGFQVRTLPSVVMSAWDLAIHRSTPDTGAIGRLLDAKYGFRQDDVDHDNFFAWPA